MIFMRTDWLGYGCHINNSKLKNNAHKTLKKWIYEKQSFLVEEYENYYKDNKEYYKTITEDEFFEMFCEYYQEDNNLYMGIEAVVVDFINEQEFNTADKFEIVDYVYHVAATLPKDEKERELIPTEKEIDSIISRYISPLYEGNLFGDWYSIHA